MKILSHKAFLTLKASLDIPLPDGGQGVSARKAKGYYKYKPQWWHQKRIREWKEANAD